MGFPDNYLRSVAKKKVTGKNFPIVQVPLQMLIKLNKQAKIYNYSFI